MLSVTSVSVPSQQVSTQAQGTTKVEGTAPFQQQLNQYVNQTEGSASVSQQSTEAVTETTPLADAELDLTVLSAEELLTMIEGLLEQVEELIDVPLTDEDQASLEAMSMQLLALLQLIAVDNNELSGVLESIKSSQLQLGSQVSYPQVNNDLLYKLQDQLLLLQQALKEGNLKVVQGQQPEEIVSQAVNQLKQLLGETKANSKAALMNQLTSQGVQVEVNTSTALHQVSLEQLKQLAKQSEYAQLASQVQQTPVQPVVHATVEVTPVTQVHMQSFDAQFNSSVSILKGQPQAPAFTMVNQFADTVKGMVLQKFDLANLTNGLSQARIMLTPDHLGSVDIRLSMQNGILTAVFQAETAMAKDALENQMSVLRSALAAQGITVERMEVTQASFSDELNWQEQRQQPQAENDTEEEQANDDSFEEQLEAKASKELGFGRSVNETI